MNKYASKVTSKGQVVIPKVLRDEFGITESTLVTFSRKEGCITLEPVQVGTSARGIAKTKKKASEKEMRDAIARGHIERFVKSK